MTRSEISSLVFQGGAVIFVGLILKIFISFFLKVLLARSLGSTEFGYFAIGLMVLSLTSTVVLLGMPEGVARFLPRLETTHEKRKLVVSALTLVVPLSMITGLTIAFNADGIAVRVFDDPNVSSIILIFGAIIPVVVTFRFTIGTIQGLKRILPKTVLQDIGVPILKFSFIAVGIFVLGVGYTALAVLFVSAYVVVAVAGIVYLVFFTELFETVSLQVEYRRLLSFSVPLIIVNSVTVFFTDVDTLLLGVFSTSSTVGVYNVAYTVAQVLLVLLTAFRFIFMPVFSELDSDAKSGEMKRIYELTTKWIFIGSLPILLVFLFDNEVVLSVLFGTEYGTGDLALAILALGFFSHTVAGPNGNAILARGNSRFIMYTVVFTAGLNFVLNLILIPTYSLVGAAMATAVSYVTMNLIYSWRLYSQLKINPLSKYLGVLSILSVFTYALVNLFVTSIGAEGLYQILGGIVIFGPLFLLIIVSSGGVGEEEYGILYDMTDDFPKEGILVQRLSEFLEKRVDE